MGLRSNRSFDTNPHLPEAASPQMLVDRPFFTLSRAGKNADDI